MRNRLSFAVLVGVGLVSALVLTASVAAAYQAVQIDGGRSHTCAVTPEATAECWGRNVYGQLGDGTLADSLLPVAVAEIEGDPLIASVATFGDHACSLTTEGAVHCWGTNWYGELGNGSTVHSFTPVAVTGIEEAIEEIVAGNYFNCARASGGTLYCWGSNSYGQLGNGSNEESHVPLVVAGVEGGIAAVGAGAEHVCAANDSGAAFCWGENEFGQLGNDSTEDSSVPVAVTGLDSGVVAIVAGSRQSCALTSSASVLCWGGVGYLGTGVYESSLVPVPVTSLDGTVVSLAAGPGSTCAVTSEAALFCWGSNGNGQIDGSDPRSVFTAPVSISALEAITSSVGMGTSYACAITTDGETYCWGRNSSGQLGNGTTDDADAPTAVPEPSLSLLALAALMTLAGLRRLH